MKAIVKKILTIGFVALLAVGMVGCNNEITAYEIAVKNGFTGTEAEWLRSLHGANGLDGENLTAETLYDTAKEHGYTGSFLDFCATLNITVNEKLDDTAQIAENMLSIVSIYCGYTQTTEGSGFLNPGTVEYKTMAGSGVIVDLNYEAGNAFIITNYHVVYNLDADKPGIQNNVWVYPYGSLNGFDPRYGDQLGDGIRATYVGGAMDYDIAILKVEGSKYIQEHKETLKEAKIGDSNDLTIGESVYAIGNPAGAGIAVTNGILSVDSEYINMYALDKRDEDHDGYVDFVPYRVMRTSAAINGGNSGGGLFNARGQLIGIVNAKSSGSETDNMGYALPITEVWAAYENILRNGDRVQQATLGILVSTKSSKAVLQEDGTVEIVETFCVDRAGVKGTAAYNVLSEEDVFLSARIVGGDSITFTRRHQLTEFLLSVKKGDRVQFTVLNSHDVQETVEILFDKDSYFTPYA